MVSPGGVHGSGPHGADGRDQAGSVSRFSARIGMRLAYVLVIALATITALAGSGPGGVDPELRQAWRPELSGRDVVDALRNILLFAGWGATWMITSSPGPAKPILVAATLTGAAISAGVEGIQLLSAARVASILDLITNTVGAFAGALGAALLIVVARRWLGRRSYVGIPALLFAGGYGVATMLEAISPIFRQQRLLGAWGTPLERLDLAFAHLREAPLAAFPLLDLVLFAPAGAFAVAALVESGLGYAVAVRRTAGVGALAYGAAELVRGAAGYAIAPGAWLIHAAALAGGAALAARGLPAYSRDVRGRSRPLTLLVVYALLLGVWNLRPFLPELSGAAITAKLDAANFIPLYAHRERVDVFTTADVAIPAFLLLPIGCLLAVWPLRRRGEWAGILPAVWLAGGLEIGQIFVSGRLFDITDVLVAIAATGLGWAVIRRAGYEPYGEALTPRRELRPAHGAPRKRKMKP